MLACRKSRVQFVSDAVCSLFICMGRQTHWGRGTVICRNLGETCLLLVMATISQQMAFWVLTACRKFGDPRLVFDTGYNLMWTLHCHNYDADCAAFLKVVMSECTDNISTTCLKAEAPLQRAVQE